MMTTTPNSSRFWPILLSILSDIFFDSLCNGLGRLCAVLLQANFYHDRGRVDCLEPGDRRLHGLSVIPAFELPREPPAKYAALLRVYCLLSTPEFLLLFAPRLETEKIPARCPRCLLSGQIIIRVQDEDSPNHSGCSMDTDKDRCSSSIREPGPFIKRERLVLFSRQQYFEMAALLQNFSDCVRKIEGQRLFLPLNRHNSCVPATVPCIKNYHHGGRIGYSSGGRRGGRGGGRSRRCCTSCDVKNDPVGPPEHKILHLTARTVQVNQNNVPTCIFFRFYPVHDAITNDRQLRLERKWSFIGGKEECTAVSGPRQDIGCSSLDLEYDAGEGGIGKIPDALHR